MHFYKQNKFGTIVITNEEIYFFSTQFFSLNNSSIFALNFNPEMSKEDNYFGLFYTGAISALYFGFGVAEFLNKKNLSKNKLYSLLGNHKFYFFISAAHASLFFLCLKHQLVIFKRDAQKSLDYCKKFLRPEQIINDEYIKFLMDYFHITNLLYPHAKLFETLNFYYQDLIAIQQGIKKISNKKEYAQFCIEIKPKIDLYIHIITQVKNIISSSNGFAEQMKLEEIRNQVELKKLHNEYYNQTYKEEESMSRIEKLELKISRSFNQKAEAFIQYIEKIVTHEQNFITNFFRKFILL